MSEQLAYTQRQAAEAIGVGVTTFKERVAPQLRSVRIGRCRVFRRSEIERWLRDREEKLPNDGRGRR